MKSKKMISMMLTLIIMSSGVVGCSSNKQTEGNQTQTKNEVKGETKTEEKEVVTSENGREMVGNMYKTGLPIVKEKVSFSIFVDDGGLPEDKIMYPILEEQTNVNVELMLYPYETAREKKNILINSGDYPDVFGGWILGESDILNDGMGDGLYIPINEYIDKYAPNMQEILEIEGVRDTMTLPDGNIYTIPYVIGEPLVPFLPWINIEWLERVGKEMPTTIEELRDVLRAFKEQDANGNGNPSDEIPLSADPVNKNLGMLAGWFGVNVDASSSNKYFAMVDGKLEFQATKDGYKEYIKYMASLYAEGLIDQELFTQDSPTWKGKGKQDLYGVSIGYGPGDFYEIPLGEVGPFRAVPVLKSDYVDKPVYRRGSYGATTFRTQVAITDKAENPEVIVRWFDNVFELENSVQIQSGLIGKRIEKIEEGQYRALDEKLLSEADREKYGWGNMFTQALPKYMPIDFKVLPVEGQPELPDLKKEADAVYEPYLDEMAPKVWLTTEEANRLAIIETDIVKYIEQKQAQWISGQADIEVEWNDYMEQLNKYGLQELTEIRTKAVEAKLNK